MAKSSTLDIDIAMFGVLGGHGYMIGGSYVVDRVAANDVDIIVHQHVYQLGNPNMAGWRELSAGDEKYDEIDHVRIITIYEGKIGDDKANIIVVGEAFWPAYMGAIDEMRDNPEFYLNREDRVQLHRNLARQVADIAGIDIPEGAV